MEKTGELRRKIKRVVLLPKAIKGEIAVTLPANLKRTTQRRNSRRKWLVFVQFKTTTHCYKYSFLPRTIKESNNLQENLSRFHGMFSLNARRFNYLIHYIYIYIYIYIPLYYVPAYVRPRSVAI